MPPRVTPRPLRTAPSSSTHRPHPTRVAPPVPAKKPVIQLLRPTCSQENHTRLTEEPQQQLQHQKNQDLQIDYRQHMQQKQHSYDKVVVEANLAFNSVDNELPVQLKSESFDLVSIRHIHNGVQNHIVDNFLQDNLENSLPGDEVQAASVSGIQEFTEDNKLCNNVQFKSVTCENLVDEHLDKVLEGNAFDIESTTLPKHQIVAAESWKDSATENEEKPFLQNLSQKRLHNKPSTRPKPKQRVSLIKPLCVHDAAPLQDHNSNESVKILEITKKTETVNDFHVSETLLEEEHSTSPTALQLTPVEEINGSSSTSFMEPMQTSCEYMAELGQSHFLSDDEAKINGRHRNGTDIASGTGHSIGSRDHSYPVSEKYQRDVGNHASEQPVQALKFQDLGETSEMLKEIEDLLRKKLLVEENSTETYVCPDMTGRDQWDAFISDVFGEIDTTGRNQSNLLSQAGGGSTPNLTPTRPPRPKRANKLSQQSFDSSSVDSCSTESLNTISAPGKRQQPPKPKRKYMPGSVSRSKSDVTGMKSLVDKLNDDAEEEKNTQPPKQQPLQFCEITPPPLPPRNKSMDSSEENLSTCSSNCKQLTEGTGLSSSSSLSAVDSSISDSIKNALRSESGNKKPKRHVPRPTRKAPPPPLLYPQGKCSNAPLAGTQLNSSNSPSVLDETDEHHPGYTKISVGVSTRTDTALPQPLVTEWDIPQIVTTPEEIMDHDYLEIPEHIIRKISVDRVKEETPPPSLPPRSYNQKSADFSSFPDLIKDSGSLKSTEHDVLEKLHANKGSVESLSHGSTTGPLLEAGHGHRPNSSISQNSSSSYSAGSGEMEELTFDQPSSGSESDSEESEEKIVS